MQEWVGRDSSVERVIRDKGEELVRRLRGNAVSGDEKPQEPEVKFRKLFGFSARRRKPWPLRGSNGALRNKTMATETPGRARRARGGNKVRKPELERGNEICAGTAETQ